MFVLAYVRVGMLIHTGRCGGLWLILADFFNFFSNSFFLSVFPWTSSLPCWLYWLVSEPLSSAYLHPWPPGGLQMSNSHICLLRECWDSQIRSCLCSMPLTHWATSSAPEFLYLNCFSDSVFICWGDTYQRLGWVLHFPQHWTLVFLRLCLIVFV